MLISSPRALLAASLAGALLSTGAVAATTMSATAADRSNVTVTIELNNPQTVFSGVVDSPRERCTGDKQVNLRYRAPSSERFFKIGSAESNAVGQWTIKTKDDRFSSGQYRVKVPDSKNCQQARSKVITIGS